MDSAFSFLQHIPNFSKLGGGGHMHGVDSFTRIVNNMFFKVWWTVWTPSIKTDGIAVRWIICLHYLTYINIHNILNPRHVCFGAKFYKLLTPGL